MQKTHRASLLVLATFAFASPDKAVSSDPDSLMDQIRACALIENSGTRFECYEALGKKVLDEAPELDANQKSAVQAAAVALPAVGLPDDIGGDDFSKKSADDVERFHGHIQSCEKGIDGRWYFEFGNGQVWKQSNSDRRKFRNCDIDATIHKDRFGYVMEIDGDDRKVRVQRTR